MQLVSSVPDGLIELHFPWLNSNSSRKWKKHKARQKTFRNVYSFLSELSLNLNPTHTFVSSYHNVCVRLFPPLHSTRFSVLDKLHHFWQVLPLDLWLADKLTLYTCRLIEIWTNPEAGGGNLLLQSSLMRWSFFSGVKTRVLLLRCLSLRLSVSPASPEDTRHYSVLLLSPIIRRWVVFQSLAL